MMLEIAEIIIIIIIIIIISISTIEHIFHLSQHALPFVYRPLCSCCQFTVVFFYDIYSTSNWPNHIYQNWFGLSFQLN